MPALRDKLARWARGSARERIRARFRGWGRADAGSRGSLGANANAEAGARAKAKVRVRERGSVSIFFIAATAGFVLFTGLLIDYARVAAFRKQAELAVMAGTRSTLAAYDPYLYSKYGLFARGGDSADELFQETLEGNRLHSDQQDFSLLDVQWSASAAVESRPLATHEVLQRQVMEEMKYKAPIDLTIEVISRWKGVSSVMGEAKSTVDKLEEMKQAYERREKELDDAMEQMTEAGSLVSKELGTILPSPSVSLSGSRSAGNAATVPDVVLMYGDYVQKRTEDERTAQAWSEAYQAWEESKRAAELDGSEFDEPPPDPTPPKYAQVISDYLKGTDQVREKLLRFETVERQAEARLQKAAQSIETALLADLEMKRIAEEERDNSEHVGEDQTFSEEEINLQGDAEQAFAQFDQNLGGMVLGEGWFDEFRQEIELQRQSGESVKGPAQTLAGTMGAIPGSSGLSGQLVSEGEQLQSQAQKYRSKYGESGSVMADLKKRIEEHRSVDEERKTIEKEANEEWKKASDSLKALSDNEESEQADGFDQLERLYRENLKWNDAIDEADSQSESASNLEGERAQALKESSGWMSAMTDAATGARDRLYSSEYVVSRLAHSEPSEVKDILTGSAELSSSPDSQQVEYILYGFYKPASNLTAAYSEILAARLSIRMVEGLIESSRYGHPLLVLAAATLYAVRAAAQDMQSLLSTGKITLSKYVAATTTYTDYLRLFLLLHGGSKKHWARMTAVMEQESGLNFERLNTYVSGQGTASISLWFFPGLIKVLGLSGAWGGTVNGERYEATYQADDAYQ